MPAHEDSVIPQSMLDDVVVIERWGVVSKRLLAHLAKSGSEAARREFAVGLHVGFQELGL